MSRKSPPSFVNWDVKDMVAVWVGTCKNEEEFRELFTSKNDSDDDDAPQSTFADLFAIYSYDENFVVQIYRPAAVALRELLREAPYSDSFANAAAVAAEAKGMVAANLAIVLLNFVHVGDVANAEHGSCSLHFIGNFSYTFEAPGLPPWLFESPR